MEPDQIAAMKQELADARQAVKKLEKDKDEREAENAKARERIRALETEKADLEAKLPAEGSITLTGDDAKTWSAYQELGKPELLRVKLEDYDRAANEAAALKRRDLVDKAARDPENETAYRYKPSVLERLLGDGATLTTTDKNGFVVKAGDTEKPLEKWLEEDQADFLPALQVAPNGTAAVRQAGDRRTTPTVTPEKAAATKRASGDYNF